MNANAKSVGALMEQKTNVFYAALPVLEWGCRRQAMLRAKKLISSLDDFSPKAKCIRPSLRSG
jgi:hypothetical protein